MKKLVAVIFVVFLMGMLAVAQETPKVELELGYTFIHYSPSPSVIPPLNPQGGGGSIKFNFSKFMGIKMQIDGTAAGTNSVTFPVGSPYLPAGGTIGYNSNLMTYMFGPEFKSYSHKLQPFGEILFGGAHSNVYGKLQSQGIVFQQAPSGNTWAMQLGGGIDYSVTKKFAVRIGQMDYLLTRFAGTGTKQNQSNFKYSAGVVFDF